MASASRRATAAIAAAVCTLVTACSDPTPRTVIGDVPRPTTTALAVAEPSAGLPISPTTAPPPTALPAVVPQPIPTAAPTVQPLPAPAPPQPIPPPDAAGPIGPAADEPQQVIAMPLRFESRVADVPVEVFQQTAMAALTDPRGWQQAGFAFTTTPDAAYWVVLAEGAEVDALCAPYTTGGRYSCQKGPMVALNADRWRGATDTWPADLAT